MKKTHSFVFALSFLLLSSCGGQSLESSSSSSIIEEDPLTILSPAGAPTLALYNHIDDENFLTTKDATQVALAMKTASNKDALIFDGVNGLKFHKAKQTSTDWKLARWLTGGNFYIVSTKHTKEDIFDENSKILSFGNGLLPDKVFRSLVTNKWHWTINEENIKYEAGTSQVSAILGSENYASYDYYFIAEPSLQAAKTNLKSKGIDASINEIYNLREEWKDYSGMEYIPQAALFVNATSYQAKNESFANLLEEVDENLNDAIYNPQKIVSFLNEKEPNSDNQADRLGFKAALVGLLQKEEANRFGMIDTKKVHNAKEFVNTFMEKIGESVRFDDSDFLS